MSRNLRALDWGLEAAGLSVVAAGAGALLGVPKEAKLMLPFLFMTTFTLGDVSAMVPSEICSGESPETLIPPTARFLSETAAAPCLSVTFSDATSALPL